MASTMARRPFWAPLRSWNTTSIIYNPLKASNRNDTTATIVNRLKPVLLGLLFCCPVTAQAQNEYVKHDISVTFEGAHAIQSHDIDNDGDLDIIGAGLTVDAVSWWENTSGDGSTWFEHSVAEAFNGARFVDAADIDGDGDLDLFGAAASDDLIRWWENTSGDGSEWIAHDVDIDFNFAMHLHAADLDDDGDLDIMGAALKGDAIHWWENTSGDGVIWTEHVINEDFNGARHVCSVDLDGDGDLDLLGSAYLADDVKWWENTLGDATTWEVHTVDEEFEGVNVVMPVDIDGDNDIDLIGSADIADDIVVWFNDEGTGLTWTRLPIVENFDGAFATFPADMDGDGDIDVVGAALEASAVIWWENTNGLGNSWDDHLIDQNFTSAAAINAADLDKDGDMDILGGSLAGEVVWWETVPEALPVELTSFDAIVTKDEVVLQWETASETNNAGFEVQYRPARAGADGSLPWEAVAFVKGEGTTVERNKYRHQVRELLPGTHKFRLKQIDFNGTFEYSAEVEVVLTTGGRQTMSAVYPNPFNPQAQFFLTLPSAQRVSIDVYNALGQKVKQLYTGLLEADQVHEFNFEAGDLPGGLYLINATGDSFSTTQRAMLVK